MYVPDGVDELILADFVPSDREPDLKIRADSILHFLARLLTYEYGTYYG